MNTLSKFQNNSYPDVIGAEILRLAVANIPKLPGFLFFKHTI